MANPFLEVQKYGQSIWYDHLRRGLITSGELAGMVERDGLLGVTSNPAVFEKAIAGSGDYDQALKALVAQGAQTAQEIYERLAIGDVQLAADILYPVFIRTRGRDGYVSFEVSPHLAHDTKQTVEEARRLQAAIRRDNVLIEIPATPAGLPAIRQLISEGIGIDVTLLFDVDVYEQVADAYMAGLEAYGSKGGDVSKVASVASFFISRIDTLVDARLEKLLDTTTTDNALRTRLKGLVGKVALANARLAYARYRDLCATERWQALAARQAMPQRLLWASTGTKNPKYPRTLYVDELIGPETVVTIPAESFSTFRESGRPRPRLTENWAENLDHAREIVGLLAEVGISLAEVARTLLEDGLARVQESFDKLAASIEKKRQATLGDQLATQVISPGEYAEAFTTTLDEWRTEGKVRRLWAGDGAVWTDTDEGRWLGWLHSPEVHQEHAEQFRHLAGDVRTAGFSHVVVLGMGGSALTPEMLAQMFGPAPGLPPLLVLDSIVPAQVRALASHIDPNRTLFVVSSKSGGTLETNALLAYFLDRVGGNGQHFIAITDPKTRLHARAKTDRFRHIFFAWPDSPGRFASLSNLGLVPATLLGMEVGQLLARASIMVHSCASCVPPELNPGVSLGVFLGTLAQAGRDKLTLVLAPALRAMGPWLEQLVSESTGKEGQGIVLLEGEEVGPPEAYGNDRAFVQIRLAREPYPEHDRAVEALQKAGHPVVRIAMPETMDLGQEMFRWQLATAVAGAVLGVDPFSQPEVEATKLAARARLDAWEAQRGWPQEAPLAAEGEIALFADPRNAEALRPAAEKNELAPIVLAHLRRLKCGDYLALNAFLESSAATKEALTAIRRVVRDRHRVATMVGFGPRLLHSTGQLHKGGPDTGVFVQLTAEEGEGEDVAIPGQKYTFGVLNRAQALGDFDVLAQRGRRLLRVHLGRDVAGGLKRLVQILEG